jgi:anti-sigma B factor antagonist
MSKFTCRSERLDGSGAVVVCAGEIDLFTCGDLKRTLAGLLQEDSSSTVVVDLSDVGFIDSAGLDVLITHHKQATEPMHVVVSSAATRRLFRITGLDTVFSMHASKAEAIASLA